MEQTNTSCRVAVSHGIEYEIDQYGIHQLNPEPFTYDHSYVHTYNTEAYKRGSDMLNAMRFAWAQGVHGSDVLSIHDHGYGNGDFMLMAIQSGCKVMGSDVTGIKVVGCEIVPFNTAANVWTFWDCIEHIPDWSFLWTARCETICISLPWCWHEPGTEWFDSIYKHRKPNEHVHHFNAITLSAMMERYGWHHVALSTHEDIIRKSTHGLPNILSMAFKRK